MRHIDPKDSIVMQEFERMAAEKGWVVQAALDAGVANQLRQEINEVAQLLPKSNVVLDMLLPLPETAGDSTDLRHALDAIRASIMDPWLAKGFEEQGGEARSLYYAARSMLHAPEGQGTLWLNGLRSLRELLTGHWGQQVEKEKRAPQMIDMEMPPGLEGPREVETGPMPPERIPATASTTSKDITSFAGVLDDDIKQMWGDLSDEQKRTLWSGPNTTMIGEGVPFPVELINHFNQPENFKKLQTAWYARGAGERWRELSERIPQRDTRRAPADALWYKAPIVGRVQQVLLGAGLDIGARRPDNVWGPKTNAAWNKFVQRYGLDKAYGLTPMPAIHSGDQSAPPRKDLEFVAQHGSALQALEGKPATTGITGPEEVETGPMPPEHIPAAADDGLQQTIAAVAAELVSLANDLDNMDADIAAQAVDAQLALYKAAADKLYDVTGETGEDLINTAHPGGGPTMVPAQDEGGKVETIVEEHKKMRERATKPPTGKQAAFVAKQLASLASRLEREGKKEAAMLVDRTLDEMRRASLRPFVGSLRKEAEPKGEILADIFSGLAESLETIEGSVQDQFGAVEMAVQKTMPISWGGRDYGAEFDEFVVDARKWAARQAMRASGLAAQPAELKHIQQLADRMGLTLMKIRAFYRNAEKQWGAWGHRALAGAWHASTEEAYHTAMRHLSSLDTAISGKQPPKSQGARPAGTRLPAEFENKSAEALNNFKGTVNALIRTLLDTRHRSSIEGLFGGRANVIKALRILSNLRKADKPETPAELYALQSRNRELWNQYAKPLQERGLMGGSPAADGAKTQAEQRSRLSKRAVGLEGLPALRTGPEKTPTRESPGRRAPAKAKRDDLATLQALMERLGYYRATVDGKWGPRSREAWEQLSKAIQAKGGQALPPAPPPRSSGPSPSEVSKAQRSAAYLIHLKRRTGNQVNLAEGVAVPENALASPASFMRALARIPASGVSAEDPKKLMSRDNIAKASSLLSQYRQKLAESGSAEAWRIWTEGGGAEALQRRMRLIDSLLARLETAGRGGGEAAPGGYGYEPGEAGAEKMPFGPLGRKAPRAPAGEEEASQRFRDPAKEFIRRLNTVLPRDLLMNMTNPRQFIWHARWSGMEGGDPRAVALNYADFLRQALGRLRAQLTPGMVAQLGDRRAAWAMDRITRAINYLGQVEDAIRYGPGI